MADIFNLSDTDESAVDEIISQAMDHSILQQIANINCASFSHSVLPSNLESRFQRLKTFPSSSSLHAPQIAPNSSLAHFKPNSNDLQGNNGISPSGYVSSPSNSSFSSSGSQKVSNFEVESTNGKVKKVNLPSGYVSSPSNSSGSKKISNFEVNSDHKKGKNGMSPSGSEIFSKLEVNSGHRKGKNGISPSGSKKFCNLEGNLGDRKSEDGNLPCGYVDYSKLKVKASDKKGKDGILTSGSSSFSSNGSDSPKKTLKSGCFWCSPKKISRKKSVKRDQVDEVGLGWGENDEVLSDLKLFPSKEQKKLMKKAMREEEKINKEAEKIVKWAQQVSARFDGFVVDDELSDDDHYGNETRFH